MGNEHSKKDQKIREEKKKSIANLNSKKEKQDHLYSGINKSVQIFENDPFSKSTTISSKQNNNFDDFSHVNNVKIFHRNKTINLEHNQNTNNIISDKNFENDFKNNNNILEYNNNIFENNNNNIQNNNINSNILGLGEGKKVKAIDNIKMITNKQIIDDEKIARDLETIEKLLEKYKIVYLDSYYFKRDKNFKDAVDRNLQGQEYVDKLLNILSEKRNPLFEKYVKIALNLKNQFSVLFEEINSELQKQGFSAEEFSEKYKEKKNLSDEINLSNSNNQNMKFTNINNNTNNKGKNEQIKPSNISSEIMDRIKSEILDKNPKVKFDEVVGLNQVKQALKEIIIIPSLRPDLFTGLRSPARGLLLFGPPGTGKTLIAKAVATECKSTFFNISASSLTSKYVGESEKLVRALFEVAHQPDHQPAIIFIDEIESILSKRSENENEASKRLKTEFLIQFDGVGTNSQDRILVIGATNRPQDLDAAVLRRLPKKIYVGPMDFEGRVHFIRTIMKNTENSLGEKDLEKIASLTTNYSNSDLKELCRQACYEPIRELQDGQLEKIKKLRPICLLDFTKAVKAVRGTLTNEMIKEYEDWNKENGALN